MPSCGHPSELQAPGPALHLQAPLSRCANWLAAHVLPLWGLLACCNVSAIIAPGRPLHHYFHPEEGYSITAPEACLVNEFSFKNTFT